MKGLLNVNNDYRRWVDYTDELFQNEILQKEGKFPPYLLNLYGLMIIKKLGQIDQFKIPPEQRHLYKIVVNVRVLRNLLNWFVTSRYSYEEIEDTCGQLVEHVCEKIEASLQRLPKPQPFSYDPICEELFLDVRELLFMEGAFKHRIHFVYWFLWKELFTNTNLRKQELAFAEETAGKGASDSSWQFAYMFQLFFAGRVDESLAALEKTGTEHLSYVLPLLDHYVDGKNWSNVTKIAEFLLNHINDYFILTSYSEKYQLTSSLDDAFYQYAVETKRYDIYEQILIATFPFSSRNLFMLYFDQKEYGKLIDFMHLTNSDYVYSEVLRTVQKEEPQYLLPYYHRKAQQAINQKNRQSYKEAVRHLKKLRTIYKKLKQEDVWEQFFQQLLQETKRLRAFQEECQRGKLIHVENETI